MLSELVHEMALPGKNNLWLSNLCQALTIGNLNNLKGCKYLEVILDWAQIYQGYLSVFSIPYHKSQYLCTGWLSYQTTSPQIS